MDFALSSDQELLVESFDGVLGKQSRPEDVRAAEPLGFDAALWRSLRKLGPVAMAVREDEGGWGASMLDLCLIAESLGRHCAPAPVIETQVTARLLARLGPSASGPSPLDALLTGGEVATTALHRPVAGTARLVPAGAIASLVLVRDGAALRAVRPDPTPAQVPNLGSLPLADVPATGGEVLAEGPAAAVAVEAAVDEWLLLTAGALVGLAASALALAVAYAKERTAFGKPIGAFQGIAHRLADVATGIDGARVLVHEAAWSADEGLPQAPERACMAFGLASDIAREATYWAMHTLGGYGVMLEHDAQLYFRRARGWAAVYGDAEAAYRRVASYRYPRPEVTA
jgi:alkylation response protein AidB-like acyl-CoA dehydrogenase